MVKNLCAGIKIRHTIGIKISGIAAKVAGTLLKKRSRIINLFLGVTKIDLGHRFFKLAEIRVEQELKPLDEITRVDGIAQ